MSRRISLIAITVATLVASLFPVLFGFWAYQYEAVEMQTEAHALAYFVSQLVSDSPETWTFAVHRLRALIDQDVVPLAVTEMRHVEDLAGRIIAKTASQVDSPLLIRSADIYDSGKIVGRLVVTHSAFPFIRGVALMALLGIWIGIGIFIALQTLPMRALRKMERELIALNGHLEDRVQLRTAELELNNRDLNEIGEAVASELRSPLNAIKGFASDAIARDSGALSGQTAKDLDCIRETADRASVSIDELAHLVRVSRFQMSVENFSLSDISNDIADSLKARALWKGISIDAATDMQAYGDRGLIRILMEYLLAGVLDSAAEHPGARIEVGAAMREGERIYFVKERGTAFDPPAAYRRASHPGMGSIALAGRQSGIGFRIAERIVLKHGGWLWAEHSATSGAAFYFTLPTQVKTAQIARIFSK